MASNLKGFNAHILLVRHHARRNSVVNELDAFDQLQYLAQRAFTRIGEMTYNVTPATERLIPMYEAEMKTPKTIERLARCAVSQRSASGPVF